MNEKRVLRLVAEVIMEALGKEDLDDAPTMQKTPQPVQKVETGSLEMNPPVPEPQVQTAPIALEEVQKAPVQMGDLDSKNKEIERLKEELSKAQLNNFNFQPVGGK